MTYLPQLAHLNQIADNYDAILCDVWGVVHNGRTAFEDAVEALRRFREMHGPVILITNAPVPVDRVTRMFPQVGVPDDCYDAVVTSGDATRAELEKRAPGPFYRIGPDYDDPLYHGLEIEFTDKVEEAACVSCTGLRKIPDDEPESYRRELTDLADRSLEMICANPDVMYKYGDRLIWSAGALAQIYEEIGGRVIRPGKPDAPIYRLAYQKLEELMGVKVNSERILAIGDGPATDVRGAVREGLDCLFIGGGIHGDLMDEGEDFLISAARVLENDNADAAYAAPALIW